MSLPADWREQMGAWIRGAAEPDPSWFGGGPGLGPAAQIAIYQEQYRLRIYDALVEDILGLFPLLGDRAEEVLWDYLRECPPHTWTLNRIADRLPGWLAAQQADPEWVDMAALDVAVAASFEAAAGTPLSPADLATLPPLRLAPHVQLLRLSASVHRKRSAALTGQEVPPLEKGLFYLVVFRRETGVRHMEVAEGLWKLLKAVDEGTPLATALEDVVVQSPELIPEIGGWFQLIGETGWMQRRDE